jgi:Zn finger protein HypA/HybF involved in hydrogenase expression
MIYTGEDNNKIHFQCEQCGKIHSIFKFMAIEDTPEFIRFKGNIINCKCGIKIVADENEKIMKTSIEPEIIHCPKCNSTQIQIIKRGWKITSGFLGSSKNERVCMNCLHKW